MHSRVDNAPPGSGQAVGWGRTGTSVNSHSDRRSPGTRGRLGNRTDTDPEIKGITMHTVYKVYRTTFFVKK
jgi:hypothetical protein